MNNYHPDQEPPSERIMLIDIGYSQYEGDYGHLVAQVVRRAMRDTINPDTGNTLKYYDGAVSDSSTGLRNCTWSSHKANALYVEDLQITNQFDKRSTDPAYGETISFKPYKVEARDALAMSKTFAALDRHGKKLNELYGYTKNYAELVIRTALALGIKRFAVYRDDTGPSKTLVQPFHEFGPSDVAYYVDKLIAKKRAGGR